MTLISGIVGMGGLILAADTEEVMSQPPLLRTHGEKLHVLRDPMAAGWVVVLAGAGDVDYIGMAKDLIEEKILASPANDADIISAIRGAINEVWRDYARYAQGVELQLLIGTFSRDKVRRFMVVNGAAVRQGRVIEARGIGDATFRGLADRFLHFGALSSVSGDLEALRMFVIYAYQQAKQTIPGVGGNTRIVTLMPDGNIQWEKSFKVVAVQQFFFAIDSDIRYFMPGVLRSDNNSEKAEKMVKSLSTSTLSRIRKLKKELERIEKDDSLR